MVIVIVYYDCTDSYVERDEFVCDNIEAVSMNLFKEQDTVKIRCSDGDVVLYPKDVIRRILIKNVKEKEDEAN